ncbi:hypothetical protein SAMN05216304_109147 [Bosea sp. OK403]|nr:hypothetical protein SAMN05216304_109147 [Bosea sp. OK403]
MSAGTASLRSRNRLIWLRRNLTSAGPLMAVMLRWLPLRPKPVRISSRQAGESEQRNSTSRSWRNSSDTLEISSPVKTDVIDSDPAGTRRVLLENMMTLLMGNLSSSITFPGARNQAPLGESLGPRPDLRPAVLGALNGALARARPGRPRGAPKTASRNAPRRRMGSVGHLEARAGSGQAERRSEGANRPHRGQRRRRILI